MEYNFNRYLSTLEELKIEEYPLEIKETFYDFILNVPYIKNLISTDRPYAKDCPRDKEGKIIVDLTNPPIITDVDYFRPTAIHFQKYGCLTKLRPNPNPNSEYGKWVREEIRRSYNGYVRPEDGAWVTGDMYFFLNYCPIIKVKKIQGKQGIRVIDFPDFLEGQWLKFMYIDLARKNAKHGAELAARGRGKSYTMAAVLAKRFILGEYDPIENKITRRVESFVASYLKNYLNEDGVLNKFESYIDFCAEHTEFPKKRLISSINNMHWLMGYKEAGSDVKKGSLNEVIGISVKDSVGKLRGKRGAYIGLEEFGCHLKGTKVLMADSSIRNVEDIHLGDLVMGDDGCARKVLKLYKGKDMMYKITLSNGDFQIVNSTHPILFKKYSWSTHKYTTLLMTAPLIMLIKNLNKGYYMSKSTSIQYPYKEVVIHPYWMGLWLGDGDKSRMAISNEDVEVLNWLEKYCKNNNFTFTKTFLKLSNKCYNFNISMKNTIANTFKSYNLINNKHLPNDYKYNSKEVLLQVLAGIIDTDGTLNRNKQYYEITLVHSNKLIIDDISFICRVLGFRISITTKVNSSKIKGAGHLNYRLRISGDIDTIPVKINRKKIVKQHTFRNRMSWSDYTFKVEPYGVGDYYGFTLDGNELFLLEDFTIVHNSFPNLIELYSTLRPSMEDGDIVFGQIWAQGCVCAGTKIWTLDGRNINIEDLKIEDGIIGCTIEGISKLAIGTLLEPSKKPCLQITLSNGNILKCSIDHPILKLVKHTPRIKGTSKRAWVYEEIFIPASLLKIGDKVCEAREISVFGKSTLFDARLIGMLIGDGSYGYNNTPTYSSQDIELLLYVENKYSTSLSKSHITKEGKLYKEIRVKGICKKLREIGIYGLTKSTKRLPLNYQTLTYQDTINLLGGLFDTDGSVSFDRKNTNISITQSNNTILEEIKLLLRKLGIICNISKINPRIASNRKDVNPYYTLSIKGRENIHFFHKHILFMVSYKLKALDKALKWFEENPSTKLCNYNQKLLKSYKIVNIEDIGELIIYNLSAIGSKTYLANNIITHNTAGDSLSDFAAASKIMYGPKAYNMLPIKNVYDKVGQGALEFIFFYPAYVNRNGCYNKDGISDITKAILEVLINRYNVKYNTTDLNFIVKTIAEQPIVPQEAIMRTRANLFPVQTINQRLNEIDNNPNIFDDVYIGNLSLLKDGTVKFVNSIDVPIREYPIKDNMTKGAIEIFEMPRKDSRGIVFPDRYIIGHDPVDDDIAHTSSLTSTFVLDLFTDRIVAEYTGRQEYADDNFEIVRRLCIFYNAKCLYELNKKGIFAYFNKMNCLQWLAETPTYLRDLQIIKEIGYGNKSRGVNATSAVNAFADRLLREWLIKPVSTIINKDGEDIETTLPNVMFVRNKALLQELATYNPRGNFDRIRAMGMVMLYRQEKIILYLGDMSKTIDELRYTKGQEDDEFFTENYDRKYGE